MPPKAKRYRVLVFDHKMQRWFYMTGPLTNADSVKFMGMCAWDTKREEVTEDE